LEELRELIKQTGAGATGWRKWLAAPKIIQHQLRLLEAQLAALSANAKMDVVCNTARSADLVAVADSLTRIESAINQPHFLVSKNQAEADAAGSYELAVGSVRLVDNDLLFIAGKRRTIEVELENHSSGVWKTSATTPVFLSYHWQTEDGKMLIHDGLRTALPRDVLPGEKQRVTMDILPSVEPGARLIEITLIFEGHYWFEERKFESCRLQVSVGLPKLSAHTNRVYNDLKSALVNRELGEL